ncbi:MAG: histidine kinase, partial [Deltaproteobacteria bacterium]
LLDFADRSRPSAPPLEIANQVDSCVDMLSSQVPDNIIIRTEFEKNLPPVSILPVHLNQLLLNLVKNGIEAIPEKRGGSITISVRCREIGQRDLDSIKHSNDLAPGRVVAVDVDDDGKGMDEKILERIFDPFFSTKEAGRGLGLAGAMGIAMRYGGTIRVTSSPGAGSHFEVWLPPAEA